MKKLRLILACLISLSIVVPGTNVYAEKPYLEGNRVDYITRTIKAFNETKKNKILNTYSYINVVENNNCRSSLSDLKVECMLSYAKNNCSAAGKSRAVENCELYSDIIVVNKLSEKTFVNRTERYRMLKNSRNDFRTTMSNRLQQKYSRIVTEYYLTRERDCDSKDFNCLAEGLDKFCLNYTNNHSLSWQYCMSASIWFIGTSK